LSRPSFAFWVCCSLLQSVVKMDSMGKKPFLYCVSKSRVSQHVGTYMLPKFIRLFQINMSRQFPLSRPFCQLLLVSIPSTTSHVSENSQLA
jgi:hypothetical protein